MRYISICVGLCGLLTGCAGSTPQDSVSKQPSPQSEARLVSGFPASNQTYRILSASTQKSLDVPNNNGNNGVYIEQWTYWGGINQRWTFIPQSNGTFEIVSYSTHGCIDIENNQAADGTRIQQWMCLGQNNQQWDIAPAAQGGYIIAAHSSGKCLDLDNNSGADGAVIQEWTCWGGDNQRWLIDPVDDNGNPVVGTPAPPATPPVSNFGNIRLHPEKIGFYMVPDLAPAYKDWGTTQASLSKVHALLPNAWIRWDNETGHYSDDPGSVQSFVATANNAGVNMIITGSAIDGYNNWWANGNQPPNASLVDFANGPYLAFAAQLAAAYPVVQFVETANEPDGPWFNTDGDNVNDFNYYLGKLQAALGGSQKILGPSVASTNSAIWGSYVNSGAANVSYHTYGGWSSLGDVGGKSVYVTEYGGFNLDPAAVLADLYAAETNGKFNNSIAKVFYQQITDNGGNRGALNSTVIENGHFALRDWFRALTLYQAVANISVSGYVDGGANDFVASDDTRGNFAMLLWNNNGGGMSETRQVPGTSLASTANLQVVHLTVGDSYVAYCTPLAQQSVVNVSESGGTVTLQVNNLGAHEAVFVTTQDCSNLGN